MATFTALPNLQSMSPANQLDGLEIKLRQLAAKMERQRTKHAEVVAENERLQRELDRQSGMVTTLREKLSRSVGDAHRETLTHCLREIDHCLDWLNRN
jgi:hypothetical protein